MRGKPLPRAVVRGLVVVTVFLAPTLVSHAEDTPRKKTPQERIQKRTYDFKQANKPEMEYALFVPSGYEAKQPAPLIVALHGLGSNPQQIIRYPGLVGLAERHGYLVVAPMGYNSRGWYGVFGARPPRAKPANLGELSEQDVLNVLGIIEKEFRINPDRVYLMGHSMGGGGTLHLGIKYPRRWAALGPIAPAIYRSPEALKAIRHVPVIVVQGEKDRLVRAKTTRRWIEKMKELEMTHRYIEVKGGGHILPAFQKLPQIFEFFNKHVRAKQKQQPKAKAKVPAGP